MTGLLACGLLLTTPEYAWAYIDPGTGSYLFQLTAAGFLAAGFTLRQFWGRLRAAFKRRKSVTDHSDADTRG